MTIKVINIIFRIIKIVIITIVNRISKIRIIIIILRVVLITRRVKNKKNQKKKNDHLAPSCFAVTCPSTVWMLNNGLFLLIFEAFTFWSSQTVNPLFIRVRYQFVRFSLTSPQSRPRIRILTSGDHQKFIKMKKKNGEKKQIQGIQTEKKRTEKKKNTHTHTKNLRVKQWPNR